jgi:peroxiredoxin
MKKHILIFGLFLIVLGCARADTNDNKEGTGGKVGLAKSMIAPDFTLNDIEGDSHTLSGYRGKIVLVDFWATWCPPCVVEVPHFVKLYNKYKEKGFVILGVSLDTDKDRLINFIEEKKMGYPVLVNAGDVSVIYAVEAIPTAYMIDREGKIAGKFVGYRPGYEKEVEKLYLKLIEEKDE